METKSPLRKESSENETCVPSPLQKNSLLVPDFPSGLQKIKSQHDMCDIRIAQMLDEAVDQEGMQIDRQDDRGFFLARSDQCLKQIHLL